VKITTLIQWPFSRTTPVNLYQNPTILDFIGARMMEMVVTAGDIRHAKLQSNLHHQQTNTHVFAGRMPFLSSKVLEH